MTDGFPGGASGKKPACQFRSCKRRGFNVMLRKILWSRKWQPTPEFLPGESHEQRRLGGLQAHRVVRSQTRLND